eukprot:4535317-Pleurochrysis_carterae.AAC.1
MSQRGFTSASVTRTADFALSAFARVLHLSHARVRAPADPCVRLCTPPVAAASLLESAVPSEPHS